MYAPRNAAEHTFMTQQLALSFVNADMWVGASLGQVTTAYTDTHNPALQPLTLRENETLWSYSDGSVFDPTIDFRFHLPGTDALSGPCLYLKLNTGYDGREIVCEKPFGYICKWRGMYICKVYWKS
jgi:hypothetical protein